MIILILTVSLFSCGKKDTDQTEVINVEAIQTQAVATYVSSLTETMIAASLASPTPTSLPTFTPPPVTATLTTPEAANPCYKLRWISDVTIPDGTQLEPNEKFTKTWLVQNTGDCAWPPGFTFRHFGGELMRGETFTLKEPIPVGAKRQISIEMEVPSGINGLIQSSWRMADTQGNFFGDTLSVNIVVGNAVTSAATSAP